MLCLHLSDQIDLLVICPDKTDVANAIKEAHKALSLPQEIEVTETNS